MWAVTTPFTNPDLQRSAEWCARMLNAAPESASALGCTPEALAAQAALETGWGRASIGNNIWGIKAGSDWKGARQLITTREWDGTQYHTIQAWFRDYPTIEDSFKDHLAVLSNDARYASVFDHDNTKSDDEFFRQLQVDGYATDPNYAKSLHDVLQTVMLFESHMTNA